MGGGLCVARRRRPAITYNLCMYLLGPVSRPPLTANTLTAIQVTQLALGARVPPAYEHGVWPNVWQTTDWNYRTLFADAGQ